VRGGLRKAVAHVWYRVWRSGAPWTGRTSRRARRCRCWRSRRRRRSYAGTTLQAAPLNDIDGGAQSAVVSGYNHCSLATRCVDRSSVRERARCVESRSAGPTVGDRVVEVAVIE
jgi:hypothetical protein